MPVSSSVVSSSPVSLTGAINTGTGSKMMSASSRRSGGRNSGTSSTSGTGKMLDDSEIIEEDMNYDGDNDVKAKRRIPRRQRTRTRSPSRKGLAQHLGMHSSSTSKKDKGHRSTKSLDGTPIRALGAKQNSLRSVDSQPDPTNTGQTTTTTTTRRNRNTLPNPDLEKENQTNTNTNATTNTNTNTNTSSVVVGGGGGGASAEGGPVVKTKALVKNLRLSRNLSRVLYNDARSPSPSRKLLAAEIVVAASLRESQGPVIPQPPPLEQTPLIMIRFTNKATPKLIQLVEQRLVKSGLIVYDKVQGKDDWEDYTYLYLTAAQEALEALAEQVRWMKRTNDTNVVEYFTVQQRRKFVTKKKLGGPRKYYKRNNRNHQTDNNNNNKNNTSNAHGGDDLFTSNEWCHLAFRLLDTVEVWMDGASSSELNLMLMLKEENSPLDDDDVPPPPPPPPPPPMGSPSTRMQHMQRGRQRGPGIQRQYSNTSQGSFNSKVTTKGGMPNRRRLRKQLSMQNLSTPASPGGTTSTGNNNKPLFDRRLNFRRQKSIMLQRVRQHGKRSTCLRHVLESNEYVDVVTPLHWGPARDAIVAETWKPRQLTPPIQDIRNYYGEDVAFYFAWMGYLSTWLVVLGVMGCITVVWRWFRGDTVDEDEFTPMYGIFAFLWGILFLRFWERHEHRLAYRWGTYSLSLHDKQKLLTTRPQFRGRLRISPVTGDYETYYPANRRRMHYAVSALVTMVMLTVAFWMMILSLNMQGYIHPERNPERWHPHNPHPFHYSYFAELSETGQLFDAQHPWRGFIPTIVHVALIYILNSLYRIIAEALTNWENHETEAAYRTSLVVKRFMFEAFDCYVALFYLAFYERDVYRLQMELATVFNIDTFRRLAMECFIPILAQKFAKWQHHKKHELEKRAQARKNLKQAAAAAAAAAKMKKIAALAVAKNKAKASAAAPAKDKTKEGSSPGSVATSSSSLSEPADLSQSRSPKQHGNTSTTTAKDKVATPTKNPNNDDDDDDDSTSQSPSNANPALLDELAEEAEKDEYEAFDDYMEIVIQFGYVTLFASAYPLASVVALAANWVEIRSDCFKLARVCRRPRSLRAEGIGVWKSLLACVVWMSALTNCLIVGFTSDQMKEIFPAFYMVDKHGDTHLVHDKGWIAVFVIFGLERLLIVTGLLIYAVVPEVPEDVQDEVERLQFIRHQEHEDILRQVMRKRNKKKAV